MSKNVLIITTSLRANSNSEELANRFMEGAKQNGNQVEMIYLRDKEINFCRGCLACQKLRKCVINDDMNAIIAKMHDADVIAFATPIYYYEMSGQMKTLLDRANALYGTDYHFRDIYMLTAAAEDSPEVPQRAVEGLGGWIECFENAHLAGTVFAGGVTDAGEIAGHDALSKAFDMGKSII
ncbi:MAG: flavodoxin family protein [Muribaculaceae bacterium]